LREPFYEEDARLRGAVKAAKFRASEVAIKYMTAMRWLDGGLRNAGGGVRCLVGSAAGYACSVAKGASSVVLMDAGAG
jgi:hypothetical protein